MTENSVLYADRRGNSIFITACTELRTGGWQIDMDFACISVAGVTWTYTTAGSLTKP